MFPACRGDPRDSIKFPVEFLNKLTHAGLPTHHLYIKGGMVLMLLRRLAPKQGLCNSTRIILNRATNIPLYCKVASGNYAREEVHIPRIEIKHQDDKFIEWNQRNFQFRPAFAMTINKTQGQKQKWESG